MDKLKAFATLFLSAIGIFGANEYYKPKNIEDLLHWQWVKLASDSKAWKSMLFENKEELRAMAIETEDQFWGWCNLIII